LGPRVEINPDRRPSGAWLALDLIPANLELMRPASKTVLMIDGLDAGFHRLITDEPLDQYLFNCTQVTRTKLLFTTVNPCHIDQERFRYDEIWLTTREPNGVSSIVSLSCYNDAR
jgi:AAA15 family ATPase/GTPase